ncbi:hypothetical protein ACSQ67_020180 [Phaseolus vulgaris]
MCVSLILFSPWKQSLSISNPKPMEFTAAEGKFHYHNNTHGIPMTTHLNSNWYTLTWIHPSFDFPFNHDSRRAMRELASCLFESCNFGTTHNR